MLLDDDLLFLADTQGQWIVLEFSVHYISFLDVQSIETLQLEDHYEIRFQYPTSRTKISLSEKSNVVYLLKRFAAFQNNIPIGGKPIKEG